MSPCFAENPSLKNIDNKQRSVTNQISPFALQVQVDRYLNLTKQKQPYPFFASVFVS